MADILDTLEWKPWPKDPGWLYADILGVARVSRKAAGNGTSYSVRALDDYGHLGSWRYTNIERVEAARIVDDAVRAASLQQAV
jgi:hypothetical protein